MREFKTTLFLVVFCLALYGGLAIFDDHEQADLEGPQRLVLLQPEELMEIEVTRPNEAGETESYVLRKRPLRKGEAAAEGLGEGWMVQRGTSAYLADPQNIVQILKKLATFEVRRTLDSGKEKLAEFGLDKPWSRITWKAPGATNAAMRKGILEIGGRSPVGSLRYARLGEKLPFYAAESWRVDLFSKEPAFFRNRTVLHDLDEADLESIRIIRFGEEESFKLARRGEEGWDVEAASIFPADPAQVARTLANLKSLRALQFLSPDSSKLQEYGLASPRLMVKLAFRNGLTTDLKVGNVDPDRAQRIRVMAAGSPQPVTVEGDLLRRLFEGKDVYRIRAILKEPLHEVERFQLRFEGESFSFANLGGPWKLEEAPEADVDRLVRVTLTELTLLSADRFVEDTKDPASFGLFDAPYRITLPGPPEFQIRFSAGAQEKGYFLFLDRDPTVYRASSKLHYQKLGELARKAQELTREARKARAASEQEASEQEAGGEPAPPAPGASPGPGPAPETGG